MKITLIETGNFMLDGGAIFGVVPKSLWSRQYQANEQNLCNMAMRSLLVEAENRLILVDTGIGNKQDAKFFSYYFLNGQETLENSLMQHGIRPENITDVILTHLHFDHAGGAVKYDASNNLVPAFPNAVYYVSRRQWEWAMQPNLRERPSYRPENYLPLFQANRLQFIEQEGEFIPGVMLRMFHGHTDGLLVPVLSAGKQTLVFVSDLLPFMAHIPLSWVCGYDTRPLITLKEKEAFLTEAWEKNYTLLFQHDYYTKQARVEKAEKGFRGVPS
jgi:glyoxylase-like metal-dependent hydrolase (beta-lactamase superfamily II)